MTAVVRFAFRALQRDLRAGDLRALALALVIAAASVSTVGFFTDRTQRALAGQAGEVLAADLVVEASRALPQAWLAQAQARGLRRTQLLSFRSVALAGERSQLVEIKAAGPGYPLRGELRTAAAPFAADAGADGTLPAAGEVWVGAGLLQALDLAVGDRVALGAREFTIARVLTFEPDRGLSLFSIGPRVLMRRADLEGTRLVQPASRVHHHLLLAGEAKPLAAMRDWLEAQDAPGIEIQGLDEARPELRTALSRAEVFLRLAALVSVLLAGVAVSMAARRHAERQADTAAILRCLGATRRFVVAVYALELLGLGLIAALVGCLLGLAGQEVIARIVAALMQGTLPPPGPLPAVVGALTALATLAGFALPPLMRLGGVSPLRVLRRDLGLPDLSSVAVYGAGAATMLGLMLWMTGDAALTAWVLGGAVVTMLALGAAAGLLVLALGRLRHNTSLAWRFGLSNLSRRARTTVAQLLAFGIGIMVLLLLTVVRTDLLTTWRSNAPPDAPNLFLINIQPDESAALREALARLSGAPPTLYPMVRGRLVALNGAAVDPVGYADPRARRLVEREFNLSYMAGLPVENRVIAGRWWSGAPYGAETSVEVGLAETLGIGLGDRLRFRVADREFEVRVTSLRQVEWGSFRVNFFVVMPPGILEEAPTTMITSLYVPALQKGALADLVRGFPSITVFDVGAILSSVQRIMDRVTLAIEFVFGFTLLAGLAVLHAAIAATLDQRRREASLLRAFGARRRDLLRGLVAEFLLLGALAGLLAAAGASAISWVLAHEVLELAYGGSPWLWIAGPLGGGLLVCAAGVGGTWRVIGSPPMSVLRSL